MLPAPFHILPHYPCSLPFCGARSCLPIFTALFFILNTEDYNRKAHARLDDDKVYIKVPPGKDPSVTAHNKLTRLLRKLKNVWETQPIGIFSALFVRKCAP